MSSLSKRSGNYPVANARAGELERLRLQHEAWEPQAQALLDQIGITPDWHCLDLGCGPKGLTEALSARIGNNGRVVGLEFDPDFAALAQQDAREHVEIVIGDAYATEFQDSSFDFVHTRFLASTAGDADRLMREARRVLRPGGVLALEEADARSLACYPPHPAWSSLSAALLTCFPHTHGDDPLIYRLFRKMRQAGFEHVQCRPALVAVRATDPWVDYLPSTIEAVRSVIVEKGLFSADELDMALGACRAHLQDPNTLSTSVTLVQVWGTKT